jgi:thymidylate synthase
MELLTMHLGKLPVGNFEQKGYANVGEEHAVAFGEATLADGRPVEITHTITKKLVYVGGQVSYEDNPFDHQYNNWLRYIMANGERRDDRTKTGTISAFGDVNFKFDLRENFPAITGKRLAFKTMKIETIDWMLKGKTDLKTLKDLGVGIWDQNVYPGTEVYEGKELDLLQRLLLLGSNQQKVMNDFLEEIGVPFMRTEDGGRDFQLSERTQDHTFAIEAKLNNWGIPERALSDGHLGEIYGKQWCAWEDIRIIPAGDILGRVDAYEKWGSRDFVYTGFEDANQVVVRREIDQIALIEKAIKDEVLFHKGELPKHSAGRRIILTGWNVAQLDEMSLPPCHTLAQWYVSSNTDSDGKHFLDCKLYLRSNDIFLGNPFNVAQYALLTEMLANVHGLRARHYHVTVGDAHIYANHVDQVAEQLQRLIIHKAPKLHIADCPIPRTSIRDIRTDDVSLVGYESYDSIKAPIAGN